MNSTIDITNRSSLISWDKFRLENASEKIGWCGVCKSDARSVNNVQQYAVWLHTAVAPCL